jgi:hypothetical protein
MNIALLYPKVKEEEGKKLYISGGKKGQFFNIRAKMGLFWSLV